jgi:hypothetical protein
MLDDPRQTQSDDDSCESVEEKFEKFVAAALKVDPKGLSGKHRRKAKQETGADGGPRK